MALHIIPYCDELCVVPYFNTEHNKAFGCNLSVLKRKTNGSTERHTIASCLFEAMQNVILVAPTTWNQEEIRGIVVTTRRVIFFRLRFTGGIYGLEERKVMIEDNYSTIAACHFVSSTNQDILCLVQLCEECGEAHHMKFINVNGMRSTVGDGYLSHPILGIKEDAWGEDTLLFMVPGKYCIFFSQISKIYGLI